MSQYELPVEFESPYSLDQCVDRLQALIGQEYLLAYVDGVLVRADIKHIDFRLHAYNHHLKAPRKYSNDLIEADLVGSLNANEDGTTYISVDDTITENKYRLYLAKIALAGFIFGTALWIVLSRNMGYSLLVGLVIAAITPLPMWYYRPYDIDKLLDLIKATLEASVIDSSDQNSF